MHRPDIYIGHAIIYSFTGRRLNIVIRLMSARYSDTLSDHMTHKFLRSWREMSRLL